MPSSHGRGLGSGLGGTKGGRETASVSRSCQGILRAGAKNLYLTPLEWSCRKCLLSVQRMAQQVVLSNPLPPGNQVPGYTSCTSGSKGLKEGPRLPGFLADGLSSLLCSSVV